MPRKVLSKTAAPQHEAPAAPVHHNPALDAVAHSSAGSTKMSPLAIAVLIIVVVTAGGLMIRNAVTPSESPASQVSTTTKPGAPKNAQEDLKQLVDKVKRHIMCKTGEMPTVATIQDVALLKKNNPAFYKDAMNGDRLLIWSDKAVLYSPSKDIILSVLPVTVGAAGQTPSAALSAPSATPASEKMTVEVRNGSGIAGLAKDLATKLTAAGMTVLPPGSAKSKDVYAKTLVYVAAGQENSATAQAIIAATGATVVTTLPAEMPSKADILVIVGTDAKH